MLPWVSWRCAGLVAGVSWGARLLVLVRQHDADAGQ